MLQTVQVIINARSGARNHALLLAEIARLFQAGGVEAKIAVARHGGDIPRLAEAAARGDGEVVVAAGGDGTMGGVASALVGTDKALGVIPVGTFNFFAKKLRIPLDIESAVRTVLDGRVTAINVGEVNGHVFLNNSTIGLYPLILHQRDEDYRRFGRSRLVTFLAVGAALLRRGRGMTIRMQADGGAERVWRSECVFVCNNHEQMKFYNIRGGECLDADAFAVLVSGTLGRLRMLRLGLQMLFRRMDHAVGYEALCARVVRLDSRRRCLEVVADGERKMMRTPLHYRIRPRALRVIVPAAATP